MLEFFKNLVLKKYMDLRLRWFKNSASSVELPGAVQRIKNILIIAPPQKELQDVIHDFASRLYKVFKPVQISTFERSSFRAEDGNWFGLPGEAYLENFRQEHFDLVLDLNIEQDRLCTYICALVGGTLRMNLSTGKYDHIYNFHIRTNEAKPLGLRLERVSDYLKDLVQS